MIRVLHVVYGLDRGGTEAFIMNLYRNIDRNKIQFDFLVISGKCTCYADEIISMGGKIYTGIPFDKKHVFSFVKRCVQIMKQAPYRAVHSHINIMNSWIMLSSWCAGIRHRISHSHDTFGKTRSGIGKLYCLAETVMIKLFANEFLACSKDAGDYLYGERFFFRNGHVVKNGINVDEFASNCDVPKDIVLDSNSSIIFGNISRFEAKKNQLFLLDVFYHVLKQEPQSFLLLGGVDGGQLDACVEKVRTLEIENRVKFIGVRYDMPQVLRLIDIYVFPSLYEGLGIVLLEAQASGCYCVASNMCPLDSDMGLNQIDYIQLDRGAEYWADRVLEGYKTSNKKQDADVIRKAFDAKGYSLGNLVDHMTDIYFK